MQCVDHSLRPPGSAVRKCGSAAYWCIRQVGCDFSESGALQGAPVRSGEVAMTLRVRVLSEEEGHRLARMTRSQKLGAGLVRRAQIIQHAVDGLSAPGIAAKMGLCGATVRFWLRRFNERGLPGLAEDMRSGRPPTYTAEERSAVLAAPPPPPRGGGRGVPPGGAAPPRRVGPAVRIVDAGPPGGLFGREEHRHEAQPGERGAAGRGAEVAPGRDLVRGPGGPGVRT